MATDAEARAAGFVTPSGTDLVSLGDDAISQNARVAYELFLRARWYDPVVPTTKAQLDARTTIDHVGIVPVSKSNRTTLGIPAGNSSGAVSTVYVSATAVGQEFLALDGETLTRWWGGPNTGWSAWKAPSASTAGAGLQARTSMETTGDWTTPAQLTAYLEELDKHPDAQMVTIGKTVKGADIPALIIGDKSKPAFLAVGGQHGNELGNTHGLMMWARHLLTGQDQMLMDLCVLIVPMLNIDNWRGIRLNANNVDLNRDWIDYTQPETRAVRDWIAGFTVLGAVDGHSFGYPREVSMRIPTAGTSTVRAKSQQIYDAIGHTITADGQFFRNYDVENHPGMMPEGMATLGIPSLFTEIPSGYGSLYGDTPKPSPNWQQRMAALTMNAAAHEVWKWTPTYPADLVATARQDTGWRRIALPTGASGTLLVRRAGDTVHVQAANINGLSGSNTVATLPTGMRPMISAYSPLTGSAALQVTTGGALQINTATATAYHVGGLSFLADHQAFPAAANYPGTTVS